MERVAIVLAGGRSKRFQVEGEVWRDKALADFRGKPLLVHVVDRSSRAVEKVVVVVNEEERRALYSDVFANHSVEGVNIRVDERIGRCEGPLLGITTGMKHADAEYCLVLPCDTPLIKPEVIDRLFDAVVGSHVVVPTWPDGTIEPLLSVYARKPTFQIAKVLCWLGRRRPDDIIRGGKKVTFVSVVGDLRRLDPKYEAFVNINRKEDLSSPSIHAVERGAISRTFRLTSQGTREREMSELIRAAMLAKEGDVAKAAEMFGSMASYFERRGVSFWAGVARENEGKMFLEEGRGAFKKAAQNFDLEARFYNRKGISSLSRHAKLDSDWCAAKAKYHVR